MASGEEQTRALWNKALAAYEADTGCKIPRDANLAEDLSSADAVLNAIAASGSEFKSLRNEHAVLCGTVSMIVTPIADWSDAIKGLIGGAGPMGEGAGIVLTSVVYLIQASKNVSEAYDFISKLFVDMHEFAQRLALYAKTPMDQVLQEKASATLAVMLRIIGRAQKLIHRGRFRQFLRVALFNGDDKTKALVASFKDVMDKEQTYVNAATYASSRSAELAAERIEARVEDIITGMDSMHVGVEDIQATLEADRNARQQEGLEKRALDALATDAERIAREKLSEIRSTTVAGTGDWLFEDSLYQDWLDGKFPILWMLGSAGVGKSYISGSLINRLFDLERHVLHYYIRANNSVTLSVDDIMRTLALQLLEQDDEFKSFATLVCQQKRLVTLGGDIWSNLLLPFFKSPGSEATTCYIVVDGLDETDTENRERFLTMMSEICTRDAPDHPIRVAIFARPDIRRDMPMFNSAEVDSRCVEIAKRNGDDLVTFINYNIQQIELLRRLKVKKPNGREQAAKLGRLIKKKVTENADGVFLWASLMLRELRKGKEQREILDALENPPATLDDFIFEIYDRIQQDKNLSVTRTNKLLIWMVKAQRPLRFGEIDWILRGPSAEPNELLWDQLRYSYSSILTMTYPPWSSLFITESAEKDAVGDDDKDPAEAEAETEEEDDLDADLDLDLDADDDDLDLGAIPDDSEEAQSLARSDTPPSLKHRTASNEVQVGDPDAQVTFHHLRMRDCLVSGSRSAESATKAARISLPIGRLDFVMAIECLDMLAVAAKHEDQSQYNSFYAIQFLSHHLAQVDIEALQEFEVADLANRLYWLYHEPGGFKALLAVLVWHPLLLLAKGANVFSGGSERLSAECTRVRESLWTLLFASPAYEKLVQATFGMHSASLQDQDDKKKWMRSASTSISDLLQPITRRFAACWLGGSEFVEFPDEFGRLFHFWIVHFSRLLGTEQAASYLTSRKYPFTISTQSANIAVKLQDILDTAEWTGISHSVWYHIGVGMTCDTYGHRDKATECAELALEQDSGTWWAQYFGAVILSRKLENYDDSLARIVSSYKMISGKPELRGVRVWMVHSARALLQECSDGAEIMREIFLADPYDVGIADGYVRLLDVQNDDMRLDEAWGVLLETAPGHSDPPMANLLMMNTSVALIGRHVKRSGKDGHAADIIAMATASLSKWPTIEAQISANAMVGIYYMYWAYDTEVMMDLLEARRELLDKLKDTVELGSDATRRSVIYALPQMCYDGAHMGLTRPDDKPAFGDLLLEQFRQSTDWYEDSLFTRWMLEDEELEPEKALRHIRPWVNAFLDCLDDDDPSNDTRALQLLAHCLFSAGEADDARAVLAAMFQVYEAMWGERQNADEEPEGEAETCKAGVSDDALELEPEPVKSTDLAIEVELVNKYCAGCLKRFGEALTDISMCEVCWDIGFCQDCLDRMEKGPDSWAYHPAHHRMVKCWPIPDEYDDVASFVENGTVKLRSEWLAGMKQKWVKPDMPE